MSKHTPGRAVLHRDGRIGCSTHGLYVVVGEIPKERCQVCAAQERIRQLELEIEDLKATLILFEREDAAPELLKALKELVERFVKAAVLAGTDKEFAEVAVREYRELIAKATEGAK